MLLRCLILFSYLSFVCGTYDLGRPLVICYETNPENPNVEKLKSWLDAFGYQSAFLGAGEKWVGFGQKIQAINKFLYELDDEQIVIISDARDVLPLRPAEQLSEYLKGELCSQVNFDEQLYIGQEFYRGSVVKRMNYFFPGEILERHEDTALRKKYVDSIPFWRYPLRLLNKLPFTSPKDRWLDLFALESEHPWRTHTEYAAVNTGCYVAKVKFLKKIYQDIKFSSQEDDQQMLSEYYFLFPERFVLDKERSLIYNCTPTFQELPGQWADSRWQHEKGQAPFFAHFLGKNFKAMQHTHEKLMENYIR